MQHDRHGWWVREATPPAPLPALGEDLACDVAIVGGGCLGLWTAWHVKELELVGFGFTGNGVGPSYLGGQILARMALDRRDELTGLLLVEPKATRFPPEPFRLPGGSAIRAALVRRDRAQDAGGDPGPATRFVASPPRRLGMHLPR